MMTKKISGSSKSNPNPYIADCSILLWLFSTYITLFIYPQNQPVVYRGHIGVEKNEMFMLERARSHIQSQQIQFDVFVDYRRNVENSDHDLACDLSVHVS
jgi:hypothetical protein